MASTTPSRPSACRTGVARLTVDQVFGRIAVAMVVLTAIAVTASALLSPQPPSPPGWTNIEVSSSGTLWEIAALHGVPGLSTAETVDLIRAENGLPASTLHTGQTLRVPTTAQAGVAVAQR